jgi:hypothetical protein
VGWASLMAGPMRWVRRHGLQCPGGRIRILAVVACKNAGYPRQRPWAFVSSWFDEAPTDKFFAVTGGCSWWWCPDLLRAGEGLDDEHRRAAVPAHEGGPDGTGPGRNSAGVGGTLRRRLMQ